jgi:hypothetical protein
VSENVEPAMSDQHIETVILRNSPDMIRTAWWEMVGEEKWFCVRQWTQLENGLSKVKTLRFSEKEAKLLKEIL